MGTSRQDGKLSLGSHHGRLIPTLDSVQVVLAQEYAGEMRGFFPERFVAFCTKGVICSGSAICITSAASANLPGMSRRLPSILTPSEIDALLTAARAAADAACRPARQHATWRDFVMVQTGLLAGPRVAELCCLEVTDIDLTGAVLAIRHGKGDKDRNVPIAASGSARARRAGCFPGRRASDFARGRSSGGWRRLQ